MTRADQIRAAAALALYLREEEYAAPEDIAAAVRRDFPLAGMSAVWREVTLLERVGGEA